MAEPYTNYVLDMHGVMVFVLAVTAFGGPDQLPTGSEPTPQLAIVEISGSERLAWEQAATASDLPNLGFVAYVDDAPFALWDLDLSCAPAPSRLGLVCSAQLPEMTPGLHTIEVAAYRKPDGQYESPRSAPVRVSLAAPSSESDTKPGSGTQTLVATDGIRLHTTIVATGLVDPTDLVTLPDGRVLIAERGGRVRVFRDASLIPNAALVLDDVTTAEGGGLLALAADLDFESTKAIFAAYTTASGVRLAKFSVVGDTLGARAILLDGLPLSSARPGVTLRMGPDRKLYLGLDDGGSAASVGDLGTFSGKVLRLNVDGTTPSDQGATPVYASSVSRPVGMDWSMAEGTLWVAGHDAAGSDLLLNVTSASGRRRGTAGNHHSLPLGLRASAIAFYRATTVPALQGNLLVGAGATGSAGSILRVRFTSSGAVASTEWLLPETFGPTRAIAVASNGTIYICSADSLIQIIAEKA